MDKNASTAFWQKIETTLAIKPVDNVKKSLSQAKLLQFQKLGATVSLASIRETLSVAFDDAAEAQTERMAGDDLDLVGDERDSRLQLAAFDNRLAVREPSGFGGEYEPDSIVADGLDWSDEALSLSKTLEADMRLEKQRRPEISTRPFLLEYFKTLRLVDLGITRVDPGLRDLIKLRSLSLSSNEISILSVPCLPPNLEVLNMYDCGLQQIKTTYRDRHRKIQHVSLPSLLHFGVGCNQLDENGLKSIAIAFPSLTSLDMCHNGLSQTAEVLEILATDLSAVQGLVLIGNSMTMELGYRSRTMCTLTNVTRLDDQQHDEDDIRAAKENVKQLGLTISGHGGKGSSASGNSTVPQSSLASVKEEEEIKTEGDVNDTFGTAMMSSYSEGIVTMRVRVSKLSGLPGPLVETIPVAEELITAAEEANEEPPAPTYVIEHVIVNEEEMDIEKMMTDAEMIDLRYFIRILPPGSMGLPQTTSAKIWTYPDIAFSEDITLNIPATNDLAFDTKFTGMKYEIHSSIPGKKKERIMEEKEADGDGDVDEKEEEEVEVELTEEEQAVKEAARLEAAKPPPRVECLVARGTMDISMCLNSMNDAQCKVPDVTMSLQPPDMLESDPLSLREMLNSVNGEDGKEAEEGKERKEEGKGKEEIAGVKMNMPTLKCNVELNPTKPAEMIEEEDGGSKPGTGKKSKPGSKKGKKKK